MENYASNLQEKIQKLIDQYTSIKKKLEELQEENSILTDQNLQLMEQVEHQTKLDESSAQALQESQAKIDELTRLNKELSDKLNAFESVANDALSKLDSVFPDLEDL